MPNNTNFVCSITRFKSGLKGTLLYKSFFLISPFFCFFLGYYTIRATLHKKELITPNLTGKKLHGGLVALSGCGLNIRLAREKEDVDIPEGIILEQFPSAGESIRLNQTIFVTISKKPKPDLTPDFLEMKYKDILSKGQELNIQPSIVWLHSNYPKENCISQFPSPQKPILEENFTIYLSTGECSLFIVPNLKGQQLSEVEEELNKYNISLETIGRNNPDLKMNYIVVDQKPTTGSIIDLNKKLYMQLLVKNE